MKNFFKSWKTTISGIAVAVLTGLFANGKLDAHSYEISLGVLAALGLAAAKDSDKSHSN